MLVTVSFKKMLSDEDNNLYQPRIGVKNKIGNNFYNILYTIVDAHEINPTASITPLL